MIGQQASHPSVWAWSVGNEIESTTPEGIADVREMAELARALDPTRPVSFARWARWLMPGRNYYQSPLARGDTRGCLLRLMILRMTSKKPPGREQWGARP